MILAHSARRGLASATGGLVIVGAGAAAGMLIADMKASHEDEAAIEAASAIAEQPDDLAPVRPVVVTRIVEEHVTPEPVVVTRKVYRTRWVTAPAGSSAGSTAGSSSRTGSTPRREATTGPVKASRPPAKSASRPARTVVAPAPAPAPAPKAPSGGAGTTSRAS